MYNSSAFNLAGAAEPGAVCTCRQGAPPGKGGLRVPTALQAGTRCCGWELVGWFALAHVPCGASSPPNKKNSFLSLPSGYSLFRAAHSRGLSA